MMKRVYDLHTVHNTIQQEKKTIYQLHSNNIYQLYNTEEELADAVNEIVNDSDSDTEGCYTRYHTLKYY